jgi:uncharacterized hydrophobic protein (TIGR00271 family)
MSNPIQDAPIDPLHQKEAIGQSIRENALFTAPYVTMNALATVVACYGLLQDSTAVVIGAMIIAMLLGPISGIALGLVSGDNALLRRALLSEVGGVLVVLGIAFCIGKIHRDLPLTNEILARTSPNILDLMIALAGGAAGAYETISPRLSVGLVGVAIGHRPWFPRSPRAASAWRAERPIWHSVAFSFSSPIWSRFSLRLRS